MRLKLMELNRYIYKLLFLVIFLHYFNLAYAQTLKSSARPNVIVILADDLGYSDLGCYGGEIQTPNLDRLAENGLRFTQFYNCGRCWPTRASLLTGYYPQQVNNGDDRTSFPPWGYLLPHHLKQAGYRNYHSGKWHVPNIKKVLEQGGFDRSYFISSYNNHFSAGNHYLNDSKLPFNNKDSNYYSTEVITDYALEFLREHEQNFSHSPFFLYVAYISPHFPLQAPQADIEKYRKRYFDGWEKLKQERYERQKKLGFHLGENSVFEYYVTAPWSWPERWLKDTMPGEIRLARPWGQLSGEEQYLQASKMAIHAAMVDRIDQQTGRILEELKSMNLENNTLILFLSDNGASAEQIVRGGGHHKDVPLGSSETYLCLGPGFSTASNTPFRRHKYWTHEGGIATPLIVCWPKGITDKGGFRHSMGHVTDFLPTILEIAGIDALSKRNGYKSPPLPGESLVPLFTEDVQLTRELYFSHQGNKALRQGKWKAVISSDIDGRWQLYNMDEDRTELNNLADDFYQFGQSLWKQMNQDRLKEMITRWEELDKLFRKQGQIGLTE